MISNQPFYNHLFEINLEYDESSAAITQAKDLEVKGKWLTSVTYADIQPKQKLYIGSGSWLTSRPKPKTKIDLGLDSEFTF